MKTVKVNKLELMTKVTENREKHSAEVEKAIAGYRAAVIKELDRMLERAKNGKKIDRYVNLVEPVDMTSEYDQVLSMLTMSVDTDIELTFQEYRQYVLDQWSWSQQASLSNSTYTG